MPFGFYMIMAAQFFSALADNALLVVAIFVLKDALAPDWQIPLLKLFFTISYVALAAFVGALADSMAKRRVMLISNGIKVVGCALMFAHVHPLLAYAVVGLGAASYSPAKYGILTEYLPHRLLVVANGWIEGLTVGAIILGVLMGGLLIDPSLSVRLLAIDLPMIDTGLDTTVEISLAIVGGLYLLAGFFNLFIPDTGVPLKPLNSSPLALLKPISATASEGSGRTSWGRFHSPSPRFSGAPVRRCSSS
jgi:LPLT family lysophospholipid transporter-like MFS transporter